MAHKLGFKVVAEGIETEEQHSILTNKGCDFDQGYLFSKPIKSSEFIELLNNQVEKTKVVNEQPQVVSI